MTRQGGLYQRHAFWPDTPRAHGLLRALAAVAILAQFLQRADFPGQGPQHDHRLRTLAAQAVEHFQAGPGIALEGVVRHLEQVVAGVVRHRRGNRGGGDARIADQQLQFLKFLYGRQQVALHPVAQQLQGIVIDVHAGRRHPLPQPARQVAAVHRPYLYGGPSLVQGLVPLAVGRGFVDPAGHHQQHVVGACQFQVFAQGLAALRAGLAAGQAQLHQLALGEQGHAGGVVQDFSPVEVLAVGLDDLAHRAAAGAGRPPYEVAALLQQQRFVTADQVDRKQLALELRGKLLGVDAHQGLLVA